MLTFAVSLEVDLTTCESEPIHIPGRIQPHGVLLAIDEPGLVITQASANAAQKFGLVEGSILGQSLVSILSPESFERLRTTLAVPDPRPLAPIPLSIGNRLFDGIAHRHDGKLILELEPAEASSYFDSDRLIRFTLANLRSELRLEEFCGAVAREVWELTGFDRVMVYRFDPDWNGEVVAEVKRDDLESFLGLHYPASDIPAQARRLYQLNLTRHIPNVDYTSAPLQPEFDPCTGRSLDLSHTVLRSVSPIHVEYLRNMGVAATLAISLLKGGQLWGLVACHHYSPKFLPYRIRTGCESISILVSLQLSAKLDAEDLRSRVAAQLVLSRLVAAIDAAKEPWDALANSTEAMIALTGAGGAAIVIAGRVTVLGNTTGTEVVLQLARWLFESGHHELATHSLPEKFPQAKAESASGLLAFGLGGGDYLMWFRPEVIGTVYWAGDPHQKKIITGPNGSRLSPRGSFELWKEEQRGRSQVWTDCDIDAAKGLRESVLAARARRAADLEAEARRRDDFLATVAHELHTPLAPIQNAAFLVRRALGKPDVISRAADMIDRQVVHLRRMVEDLLDASRAGRGKLRVDLHRIDVREQVKMAAEDCRAALETAGLVFEVRLPIAPVWILADPIRLVQMVDNLLGNSAKFSDRGGKIVLSLTAESAEAEIAVADCGIGISTEDLPRVFDAFAQLGNAGQRSREGLGLGLALVKAIAELHGGNALVESAGLGLGATFKVRMPLDKSCEE